MNKTMLTVFVMLVGASLFLNLSMNFMADNIADFENVALPPKKPKKKITFSNPVMKVDATSRDSWTLVKFSTGKTHIVKDLEKADLNKFEWDLGFQRTKIITNSGATNLGGKTGVINLGKKELDDVIDIPQSGFVNDAKKWGSISNQSIAGWYNYRTRTHNIESNKFVYLIRTKENGYIKIKIHNYYCKRDDATECATVMCARDEAACLTIEYVYLAAGKNSFPINSAGKSTPQKSS